MPTPLNGCLSDHSFSHPRDSYFSDFCNYRVLYISFYLYHLVSLNNMTSFAFEFYVNGIMLYFVSFFSIVFVKFFHVVCRYNSLFTHSTIDRHLDSFQFGAINNNAIILVQVPLYICVFYISRDRIAGSYGVDLFNFTRYCK